MSELLDSYLADVAAGLPRGQQDDIVAELRDLLLSQIEAREEAFGHPLTRPELKALLTEFGHPLEVAGRYGKTQHLVGPEVYPFYVYALKMMLGLVAAIQLAGLVLGFVVTGKGGFPVWRLAPALLITFAAVTLCAALIERFGKGGRYLRYWRPSHRQRRDARRDRRACDLFLEAALGVAALLWWVGLTNYGLPGGRQIGLEFAPIWRHLYWPILLLIVLQIALDVYALAIPGRYRTHAALRIGWHLCMLPVLLILAQAGHWFDVTIPGQPEAAADLESQIDRWFPAGVGVTLIIMLIETARAALRFLRGGGARSGRSAASP